MANILTNFVTGVFGSRNQRLLKKYQVQVDADERYRLEVDQFDAAPGGDGDAPVGPGLDAERCTNCVVIRAVAGKACINPATSTNRNIRMGMDSWMRLT